jgi:hypothetical protein
VTGAGFGAYSRFYFSVSPLHNITGKNVKGEI